MSKHEEDLLRERIREMSGVDKNKLYLYGHYTKMDKITDDKIDEYANLAIWSLDNGVCAADSRYLDEI